MRREIYLFHNETEYITVQVLKREEEKKKSSLSCSLLPIKGKGIGSSSETIPGEKGNCFSKGLNRRVQRQRGGCFSLLCSRWSPAGKREKKEAAADRKEKEDLTFKDKGTNLPVDVHLMGHVAFDFDVFGVPVWSCLKGKEIRFGCNNLWTRCKAKENNVANLTEGSCISQKADWADLAPPR